MRAENVVIAPMLCVRWARGTICRRRRPVIGNLFLALLPPVCAVHQLCMLWPGHVASGRPVVADFAHAYKYT